MKRTVKRNDEVSKTFGVLPSPINPLSAGCYHAKIMGGQWFTNKKGTRGIRIWFEACDTRGYARHAALTIWFTENAAPSRGRILENLGMASIEDLVARYTEIGECLITTMTRSASNGYSYSNVVNVDVPSRENMTEESDVKDDKGAKEPFTGLRLVR